MRGRLMDIVGRSLHLNGRFRSDALLIFLLSFEVATEA